WTNIDVTLYGEDTTGRTNSSSYAFTTTENTPPPKVMLITPLNNIWTNIQTVEFLWQSVIDPASGISNYIMKITNLSASWSTNVIILSTNLTVNSIPVGTNYWNVQAEDRAGYTGEPSSSNSIKIDMTPPNISLSGPMNGSTSGYLSVTFNWTASDASSGITNQRIEIDTNNNPSLFEIVKYTNTGYSFTFQRNGTNHWRVWAKDRAGNTNYSAVWNISINTASVAANLYYPADAYVNTDSPQFFWSDESSRGVSSNIIQIAVTSNFSASLRMASGGAGFTNWTVNPPLTNGRYYWMVQTYRLSTSTWFTSETRWVWVDTNFPTPASLIAPPDSTIFTNASGGIDLLWNSSVDTGSGINFYRLYIDDTAGPWSTNIYLAGTNINVSRTTEGIYEWYVRSYDMAGNSTRSSTNTYFIDLNPPGKTILVSPVHNTVTNVSSINFVWNRTSEAISGIAGYGLTITNSTTLWKTNITTALTNRSVNDLNEGVLYWYVSATDGAGRRGEESQTNRLTISYSDPYFSDVLPWDNQVDVATNADITFNIFDSISVVSQSIGVRINGALALTNGLFQGAYSGSITASNSGYAVIVDPAGPFASDSIITVRITGRNNNNRSVTSNFSFRTIDTVGPSIINTQPANSTTNISIQSNIILFFNDSMRIDSTNCFSIRSGSGPVNGSFSFISNSYLNDTLVFDPSLFLSYNTFYTVTISTNAWDTGNNVLQAGTNFTFKTVRETNKIRIVDLYPPHNSINVPVSSPIRIQFSGSMNTSSTSAFSILPPVAGSFYWRTNLLYNDTLYFQPSTDLPFLTAYTCTLTTNAISIYGNRLIELTNIVFTTIRDLVPPANVFYLKADVEEKMIRLTWQNPMDTDFMGTAVYFRTDGRYPLYPGDGILLCDRPAAPGTVDSFLHEDPQLDLIYYYTAFTYDNILPPNYSVPDDNARAQATLGKSVDIMDIRPNKMSLTKDGFVEIIISLSEAVDINIEIFNIAGEKVKTINGPHSNEFQYKWYGAIKDKEGNVRPKVAPGAYFAVFKYKGGKIKIFYIIK
ncbi:MAG: Ig-like domain-containing protein, partial [Spirochaetes bacterium]|nr:Ig-like domain-containing protein [Spirochaetota bacterium]